MPVYDALSRQDQVTHILCRHEQGCAFAAQGYARSTGKVAVCMATSGPGATNLITGIADAHLDSIPLLVITGQVETGLIGTDAFQEVDILGMTQGIVKHNFQVTDPDKLAQTVLDAYTLCQSGRPGPVLIDLPKDIQKADVSNLEHSWNEHIHRPVSNKVASEAQVTEVIHWVKQAIRPVLLYGGGIKIANAEAMAIKFAETCGLPVTTTLNCVGLLPSNHPLYLGMIGMHGTALANDTIQATDLLISIGARFDDRATGNNREFAPHAKIIHIDIDPCEHNKNIKTDLAITADALDFLTKIQQNAYADISLQRQPQRPTHLTETDVAEPNDNGTNEDDSNEVISSPHFIWQLSQQAKADCLVTVDVGQHQMWVAQYYGFTHAKQFFSSSGLGTMGFGLPAAIGVQLAQPDKQVINITGDGSFMMNLQELATVKRYNLPLKIILFNNQHLGLVRQQQELFYDERYSAVDLSDNPNFSELVRAFGFDTATISKAGQSIAAISWLTNHSGPAFLEVAIPAQQNVWPFVVPGQSNSVRLTAASNRMHKQESICQQVGIVTTIQPVKQPSIQKTNNQVHTHVT